MKISLNWLNDYIQTGLDAEAVADLLSDLGFPCEGIERFDDDFVIDVEITSNRGDCLGYIGIARELAAVTGKEFKIPPIELDESDKDVASLIQVQIDQPELCCRYTARVIEGVKVGPSPDWMKKRLEAIGLRSVNNVVDATNYAMIETAQPPHAFDYDKIAQGTIVVRNAILGETIVSIDGTKCELAPNMLIIADADGPIALAGVMGGLDTEVSDITTTILLEEAYFDPVTVRTTSRKLALPSEASFRFERTVDRETIDFASKRTAQLITQVAGGKVAKGVVDVYPKTPAEKQVTLRLSRLNKLLGIEVPPQEVETILSSLNFQPQCSNGSVVCSVPTWRNDVYREADLIEEVARVHGYDKIPTESRIKIEVVPVDPHQKLVESIGKYLNGCGFSETINVTFIDDSINALFAQPDSQSHLAVKDISRKSANILRRTLLGSLLGVLKTNLNAGNTPCRIFEIADTFLPSEEACPLPNEKTKLALACDADFRDLRGAIEVLIKSIDRDAQIIFTPAELIWAETGAKITVNGNSIGTAGLLSQTIKDKFDFKEITPVAAELDFAELMALQSGPAKVKPIPRFPAVERDLSVIVDEKVPWSDITEAVSKKAPSELEDIRFIGIYRGKAIGNAKKSVTLSLRFRNADGTMTHETVDRFEADIVKSLTKSTGAELRTV